MSLCAVPEPFRVRWRVGWVQEEEATMGKVEKKLLTAAISVSTTDRGGGGVERGTRTIRGRGEEERHTWARHTWAHNLHISKLKRAGA